MHSLLGASAITFGCEVDEDALKSNASESWNGSRIADSKEPDTHLAEEHMDSRIEKSRQEDTNFGDY
jgi:hypothetical protein